MVTSLFYTNASDPSLAQNTLTLHMFIEECFGLVHTDHPTSVFEQPASTFVVYRKIIPGC